MKQEQSSSHTFHHPIIYSFVLILGMYMGFKIASNFYLKQNRFFKSTFNQQGDLEYILSIIATKYVDSIDDNKLYDDGIAGLISSLDPHTVYIPPQKTEEVNNQLEGNLYGVGVEFFIYKDTVRVLSTLPNSPASKSIIRAGDVILKVNDSLIAGKTISDDQVVNMIKGEVKTKVELTIMSPDHHIQKVELFREQIAINSIEAAYVMPSYNDIGYIRIKLFSENTHKEFKEALSHLKKQNITKLIIDVRQNPGGHMRAVTSILDELIAGSHTLLSTKSKSSVETIVSRNPGIFENEKVCVLINEASASASEILAGAIQDLDRGFVIGSRSFGKGLVQEQFPLPNGGALRLTIARYYLPSGRNIQKDYSNGKVAYMRETYLRHFKSKNKLNDSSDVNTQNQFFTTKKRKVYANEGISPDFEVLEDSVYYSKAFDSLYQYNLIELFAAQYYFFQKNEFKQIQAVTDLIHYSIHDSINEKLFKFIQYEIPTFSKNEFNKHKNKIDNILLAKFALYHFSKNEEFLIMGMRDKEINKAIDVLNTQTLN